MLDEASEGLRVQHPDRRLALAGRVVDVLARKQHNGPHEAWSSDHLLEELGQPSRRGFRLLDRIAVGLEAANPDLAAVVFDSRVPPDWLAERLGLDEKNPCGPDENVIKIERGRHDVVAANRCFARYPE